MSYGLRFDYLNGWVPAQSVGDRQFLPAHEFEAVHDVPSWKDVNSRMGVAYDLFGNGRTAVKMSLNRYVELTSDSLAVQNPITTSVTSVNRNVVRRERQLRAGLRLAQFHGKWGVRPHR